MSSPETFKPLDSLTPAASGVRSSSYPTDTPAARSAPASRFQKYPSAPRASWKDSSSDTRASAERLNFASAPAGTSVSIAPLTDVPNFRSYAASAEGLRIFTTRGTSSNGGGAERGSGNTLSPTFTSETSTKCGTSTTFTVDAVDCSNSAPMYSTSNSPNVFRYETADVRVISSRSASIAADSDSGVSASPGFSG